MCKLTPFLYFITNSSIQLGSSRIRVYNLLESLKNYFKYVFLNEDSLADIIVFQKIVDLKTLKKYRNKGLYTCYDIDDLYPNTYSMVKYVDLVIVSTEYLKTQLEKFNKNIIVIPNSIDIENYSIPLKNINNSKNPSFCWYGWSNNSYILDKLNIRDLVTTISDNGDIQYNVFDIDKTLQNFDYVIIPQEKTPHTLSKTHCRFLKSLYLGIPTIVSDMPEYVKLAEEINYPKEYVVTNINDFKVLINEISSGKISLPTIDFTSIRKKILQKYAKEIIAQEFAHNIIYKYQTKNIIQMQDKTKSLQRYLLFSLIKNFLFNILSIQKNQKNHIVISILGIKIKFKNIKEQ